MAHNKGLSCRFRLYNGKFELTEGSAKAKDNLLFFMNFIFLRRTYMPAFNPDLLWLVQKPTSTIAQYKVLILGNLKKKIALFVPSIKIDSQDIMYERSEKKYAIFVNYTYTDEGKDESDTTVTFV